MLGTTFALITTRHIAFIYQQLTPLSLNRLSAKHFPLPDLQKQAESVARSESRRPADIDDSAGGDVDSAPEQGARLGGPSEERALEANDS